MSFDTLYREYVVKRRTYLNRHQYCGQLEDDIPGPWVDTQKEALRFTRTEALAQAKKIRKYWLDQAYIVRLKKRAK